MLWYAEIFLAFLFFLFLFHWGWNKHLPIINWPVFGMLPGLLQNAEDVHNFVTRLLKYYGGTVEFRGPWFTNMNFVVTGDPANIHHVLNRNFSNYEKGPEFREIFEPLGDGIIGSDSDWWRYQRKVLQSMIKSRKFELFLEKVSRGMVEKGLIPILDHVSNLGIEVDLQDIFQRCRPQLVFWLVATHASVEAKILEEIKEQLPANNENQRVFSVDELSKLVYLHAAICESLRLFPSLPFEHLHAVGSDILPSGHSINPNTRLLYSIYSMGRMESIWGKDCLEFKPERWISEEGQIVHVPSHKFLTFNTGPRSCVGKHMTFILMKMAATAVLLNYRVEVVEGHPIMPNISVVLHMKHGLKVRISKRRI
ncbi:Cytochrome P450 86A2 [Morella rubra]|uniref:Cytochrome P450 86A2 n=1 Tax=Morella rubra TaxID=262757 RepID=A0A6A1V8D6_9ROSI|nr:Cytochrome P450 86A2 [Morella rubra]